MRASLYVGERGEIDLTQPTTIRVLGAATEPGIVARRVEGPPSANPAAATTDAYFMPVSSDPNLTLGARVSVELPLRESQKALVIPDASVLYDLQGGTWVYEASGNRT